MKEILTMLLSLLVVIGVIYLTYWFCRQLSGQQQWKQGQHIRIVERMPVGRDKQILIVQVEEQQYLIGCSEQSLTLLDKLEENIVLDQFTADHAENSFQRFYQRALQKRKKEGEL